MEPKTLEALQQSIEHWHRLATGTFFLGEGYHSDDCALCKKFLFDEDDNTLPSKCEGCPIKEKTNKIMCWNTPWIEVHSAYFASFQDKHSPIFKEAATKMLIFLIDLLPTTELKQQAMDKYSYVNNITK